MPIDQPVGNMYVYSVATFPPLPSHFVKDHMVVFRPLFQLNVRGLVYSLEKMAAECVKGVRPYVLNAVHVIQVSQLTNGARLSPAVSNGGTRMC